VKSEPRVTFYFPERERDILVEQHDFYVKEAKSRLLSQFSDIEAEADVKAEETLERLAPTFNPDKHDEADFYELAQDKAISHWMALDQLRSSVGLAVAAGMFHQFDKTLRDKVVRELSHCLEREFVEKVVWSTDHPMLIELLQWLGIALKEKSFSKQIDVLRLVINVYKHGDGGSHKKLSKQHPKFYEGSAVFAEFNIPPDFDKLTLSVEDINRFAAAIKEFWHALPHRLYENDMKQPPTWLDKKYEKYTLRKQRK